MLKFIILTMSTMSADTTMQPYFKKNLQILEGRIEQTYAEGKEIDQINEIFRFCDLQHEPVESHDEKEIKINLTDDQKRTYSPYLLMHILLNKTKSPVEFVESLLNNTLTSTIKFDNKEMLEQFFKYMQLMDYDKWLKMFSKLSKSTVYSNELEKIECIKHQQQKELARVQKENDEKEKLLKLKFKMVKEIFTHNLVESIHIDKCHDVFENIKTTNYYIHNDNPFIVLYQNNKEVGRLYKWSDDIYFSKYNFFGCETTPYQIDSTCVEKVIDVIIENIKIN